MFLSYIRVQKINLKNYEYEKIKISSLRVVSKKKKILFFRLDRTTTLTHLENRREQYWLVHRSRMFDERLRRRDYRIENGSSVPSKRVAPCRRHTRQTRFKTLPVQSNTLETPPDCGPTAIETVRTGRYVRGDGDPSWFRVWHSDVRRNSNPGFAYGHDGCKREWII